MADVAVLSDFSKDVTLCFSSAAEYACCSCLNGTLGWISVSGGLAAGAASPSLSSASRARHRSAVAGMSQSNHAQKIFSYRGPTAAKSTEAVSRVAARNIDGA